MKQLYPSNTSRHERMKKFGSYTSEIETVVALIRNRLPRNPNLRSAYLLLYNSTRAARGTAKISHAKKIIMKELGVRERTAERWLREA